jgi:P pilus assembly chaperone PapD
MRRLALAAALLAVLATPGSAPAAVQGVTITLRCAASPERLTIRNDRRSSITITSVGSTYQPRAEEPFYLSRVLAPGTSVTYTFGNGKGPNRLTHSYIFDNESSREGARVRTDLGTIQKGC